MDVLDIRIDKINIPARLRPLDQGQVDRIASSISEIGLKQPISVRLAKKAQREDGEIVLNQPFLVAGRHRLEALRQLGRSHAPCIEIRDDDLLAELWEIDENLIRAELTPAQTAAHLKRRKELWEALNNGATCTENGRGRPREFASETAEKIGSAKSTVTRAISRAEALGDDIQRVTGTSLDSGVELDALAKVDPEQRAELIERAEAGEKVSARGLSDYAQNESKTEQREWSTLCASWNRARVSVRERFLQEVRASNGSTEAVEWR